MKRTLTAVVVGIVLVLFSITVIPALACIGCGDVAPPPGSDLVPSQDRDDPRAYAVSRLLREPIPATPAPVAPRVVSAARQAPTRLPVAAPAAIQPVSGNCARVAAAWPGDDAWVIRNARRESGCSPTAYSPAGKNGPNAYYGVLQNDMAFWRTYGGGPGDPRNYSIEAQVAVSWRGYQARGCQPWGCR